ncbi:MAG: glutamine synthetase III [Clostridia bacterium]|nr:glutamine synthetase III [Clostridia bacterium]MBQ6859298.1 glutamine synthetase III [Clostridia bacterium]MBQ7053510.1 glutamine synthetase III [Clostridia bacterium]
MSDKLNIPEIYGSSVFGDQEMRARLPKAIYKSLKRSMATGEELDPVVADATACAMKEWAIEKGATHYTHWFQPLTGTTAEKHDSFINPQGDGSVIMELSGKELIKGEPDASSFPSGGIRATFEARGYTVWDITSSAFIYDSGNTKTLCIPTAFCSYTGEALDKKTPLLRSMEAISKQAVRICRLFGDTQTQKVIASVGAEQEYFIVDRETYLKRKDLIFTGRTLFGAMPPKGQEMEDHYFGAIKERVSNYMRDLDVELWKLGVSAKTEHNEAAPAQHELAPIYNTANLATDENMLIMNVMKKVALRHGLVCLLHEKPFAGVNGSGKHNNWSLTTDGGRNLLSPGKDPQTNDMFLLMLAAMMKAVDEHAGLLRMSASNPGNDHRLGGHEAPPAIISMFLGEQLTAIVEHIIAGNDETVPVISSMKVGVSTLPVIRRDAGDRNRTSPFAFTGNKFEFRMTPSSGCIADANTVLNTIAADALCQFADELEKAEDFTSALHALIRREMTTHQRIIFNGNGYTDDWVAEAARRGLPNVRSMVDAIPELTQPESVALFERHGVYTEKELRARADVSYELYAKTVNIEALTMIDMVGKDILPAVIRYTKELAEAAAAVEKMGVDAYVQKELLTRVSVLLRQVSAALSDLRYKQSRAAQLTGDAQAKAYYREICPAMEVLRAPVDHLEMIVDSAIWPMPTYGDLMFNV